MKRWYRRAPIDFNKEAVRNEVWEYEKGGNVQIYPVKVSLGKNLDVTRLKGNSLEDVAKYHAVLSDKVKSLYGSDNSKKNVLENCPCCFETVREKEHGFRAFHVDYVQCEVCSHVFIQDQPSKKVLVENFRNSEEHSECYVDKESLEYRLKEVVQPKLSWMLKIFKSFLSRDAKRVLDVGAGGGHFMKMCQQLNLQGMGYEINEYSRKFAKEVLGVNLEAIDFLSETAPVNNLDVITFWGLLEYTPYPADFIKRAREILEAESGLLVVEVPRFDSISTVSQNMKNAFIARHMCPITHMNCFSDSSLATLLVENGFKPVAAWYFGMDAYELLTQISMRCGDDSILNKFLDEIPGLQAALDRARLCDDIIMAAIPC